MWQSTKFNDERFHNHRGILSASNNWIKYNVSLPSWNGIEWTQHMENGEWEPDPRDAACRGEYQYSFLNENVPDTWMLTHSKLWCSLSSHKWTPSSLHWYTGRCNSHDHMLQWECGKGNQTIFCTPRGTCEICETSTGLVSGNWKIIYVFYILGLQKFNTVGSTNVITIFLATSFAVILLISSLLIIIGTVCCWRKRKQKHVASDDTTNSQAYPTIYEEVIDLPRASIWTNKITNPVKDWFYHR